ncbi:MAG: WYL domain-containing protein, partial [Bacteroidales bacterium]|nr:WYL domain-containing protein [Bacteroidales bacterium]
NSPIKQGLRRKLAAVYDISTISSFGGRKADSAIIDALTTAIKEKRTVVLHRYSSSHSGAVKDYMVEPYRLNNNYIDIWAYDTRDGMNKRFKVSRIDEVELLDTPWQFEDKHEDEPLDAFRTHGHAPIHVKLRLDYIAKNLLVEEYPLAEKGIAQEGSNWIWEGDVRSMDGVGRFVLGLPQSVQILEGDGLREFVEEKAALFTRR